MRRLLPFIGFFVLVMACLLLWRWSLPVPEPTPTAVILTAEPTSTMSSYPTGSYTPDPTASPTAVSPTATVIPTDTPTPTETPTPEPTAMPTAVPTITPEPTAVELPEFYVVKKDDWLIRIAMRLYNSAYGWEWRCLYRMNRGIIGDDPNLVYRGMVLKGIRECAEVRP